MSTLIVLPKWYCPMFLRVPALPESIVEMVIQCWNIQAQYKLLWLVVIRFRLAILGSYSDKIKEQCAVNCTFEDVSRWNLLSSNKRKRRRQRFQRSYWLKLDRNSNPSLYLQTEGKQMLIKKEELQVENSASKEVVPLVKNLLLENQSSDLPRVWAGWILSLKNEDFTALMRLSHGFWTFYKENNGSVWQQGHCHEWRERQQLPPGEDFLPAWNKSIARGPNLPSSLRWNRKDKEHIISCIKCKDRSNYLGSGLLKE